MKEKYSRWNIGIAVVVIAALLFTAACNYIVDPYGYFTFQSGEFEDVIAKNRGDTSLVQREYKYQHILRHAQEYDAYLIGGSKAGNYRSEKLSEMDGLRYYNLYNIGGTFAEYEMSVRFLLEHAAPKKIAVNISCGEIRYEKREGDKIGEYLPAVLTGDNKAVEYVSFLFKSVKGSIEKILDGYSYVEFTPGGERNGTRTNARAAADWEGLTQTKVLVSFASHMRTLFMTEKVLPYAASALNHMKNIKQMCDAAGVELMVIIAPTFIGEASEHEGAQFREFLINLALVTDYWDFSGYHEIDLNPYNFYNEGHFYHEIGDLVTEIIGGKASYPGFGTYVTSENVVEHIAQRTEDYLKLQQEYLETGTIRLQGKEDPSCIYDASIFTPEQTEVLESETEDSEIS